MNKTILYITAFLMTILFFACKKDSTGHDHDHHFDAVGMRIVSSGQTLTSYIRDDISAFNALALTAGQETAHMDVEFFNDEDDEWETPDEDDYSLEISIADTNTAQYGQHEGEEGGFEFHLRGKQAGQTSAAFRIMHDGHADFESRPVILNVN